MHGRPSVGSVPHCTYLQSLLHMGPGAQKQQVKVCLPLSISPIVRLLPPSRLPLRAVVTGAVQSHPSLPHIPFPSTVLAAAVPHSPS